MPTGVPAIVTPSAANVDFCSSASPELLGVSVEDAAPMRNTPPMVNDSIAFFRVSDNLAAVHADGAAAGAFPMLLPPESEPALLALASTTAHALARSRTGP